MNTELSKDAGFGVSSRNYGLVPMPGQDAAVETQLARLEDFVNAEYDAEAAKRAREYYGDDVPLDYLSDENKSFFVGAAFARIKGVPNNPEAYWHAQKKDIPDANREQLFELMGSELRQQVRGRWDERQRMQQELQRELDDVQSGLSDALPQYALGEELSPELMDRVSKFGTPDELFPSLRRARAAVELVRGWNYGGRSREEYDAAVQERFERLKSEDLKPVTVGGYLTGRTELRRGHDDEELLQQARADEGAAYMVSRDQIADLADVLADGSGRLDKGAVGAFLLAIDADASGQQTIDSRFIRNALEAMKGGLLESADFLNRGNAETGMIWQGPDMAPIYLDEAGRQDYARGYSDNVEALRGHLAQLEGRRLDAAERAKFYSWLLTKGGTIVGENVPYLVTGTIGSAARLGYVGTAVMGGLANAPAVMNREIAQAAAEGQKNAEFVGSVKGLAQSWAEAAFVPLPGGTAIVNRTLDSLARKAISLPGAGKVIGAVWGNGLLRYVSTTAGASAGELLGEEVLAQTVQYPVLAFARAAGMDLDEPEWQPFADSWRVFNDDPRQAAATVVYCALMGASGARGNAYAAREFAKEHRNLMAAGLKPGSARRLSLQAEQAVTAKDVETLCTDMRETYRREVREGDQVALKKRLEKEGESFLEEVEVQMYARSGVRDYVLKRARILAGEKTAAGLNRISLPNKETPDKPTVLEWTDEQLNAWVAMQHESKVVETMRELQARVAGAALGDAAVDEADFKGVLVNMRELPVRALARMERTGGRVTYDVLKDLAADAREQVAGFVEGGMSEHEAYQQMSEIPGVRLGTLVNAAEGFTQRVEAIVGTPEGDALGITRPEDASTSVFRLNGVAPGQSVLLFNKGLATEREMVEDLIERDVIAATSGEHAVTTLAALEKMLRRVQSHLVRYEGGMRLLPKDKTASEMDIVEAFSKLAQSRFLLNHEQYSMPQEAHDTIEYVQKKLAHTQHLVALSRAWDAFARSEEGRAFIEKEGATLEKLMSDAGASVAGQYSRARFDADAFAAVREAYEMSVASPEAAQETLREYEAEQQELDHPQEQEGSIPASASITGEALPLFDSEPVNQETGEQQLQPGEAELSGGNLGRSLVGERYVEVGDGSVLGVAEVGSISLSDDVPQFKKKESAAGRVAADEDGTTHELAGGWNANSAPIHVWRRVDGRLEVISGRHRLAHARRNGVRLIQVRVYDESAERDAAWAKLHDVEQNILDNTCNAIDVAYYFRHNPLSMAEAEARGLLPKTKAGEQTAASRIGLTVAAHASDDTFALLVNGKCSAEDAYMACLISASDDGQKLALEARSGKNGKRNSWEYVTALVRGAEQMRPDDGGMLDLFGNDELFRERSEKLARFVAAVRDGLKARISIFVNSSKLNRRADVARELGVRVNTPEDATRLISRLANLDAAYERLDPDLGIPARAEAWDGKSAVPTSLDELAAGSSYSLSVKSATENRGAFDGGSPDITLSMTGRRNLAAVHSLSPEKFLAAVELGGMPMPSVAVTRLDSPYEWGGAGGINLIGKPEMVDPRKKSKVYMHDAYTGKMPPVMYRKKNTEGAQKLKEDALEKLAPYGMDASDGLMSGIFSNDYNESVVDGYHADWGNNRALMAYWAITQAGYAPKPKMKEAEGRLSPELYKALKPWVDTLPKGRMFSDDYTEDMLEGFRAAMVGYFEGKGKAVLADNYRGQDYSTLQLQAMNFAESVRKHTTKKVPDAVENGKRFVAYATKRHKAFKAWADTESKKYLGEKVFSRKFMRRNWRGEVVDEWWGHEKYTLSNLMKYMREEKGRGEESASMSPGLFLAVVSEEFRSLREMQSNRDRIVDSHAHQDARDDWQKSWDKFNKLAYGLKKPGWGSYFEIADAALWRLLELVQGARNMPSREAVERKLNESKDGWTDEHVDAAMELLSKAIAMPSDYMEAIPQRAVKMDEWEYAVLPVGLKKNKAVMEALRENGIKPIFHDGTEEGRRAALAGLVDDSSVSFSLQSVMTDWKNTLEAYFKNPPLPGTPAHTHDLVVCPTPAVMRMVGARGWDMVVTLGVLDKVTKGKHSVSAAAMEQLPAALSDPICIAVSDTPGCMEAVTELKEGLHNVLVAVQLDSSSSEKKEVKVNRIASIYGKEKIASLLSHPMLYWDKAKARVWMQAYRLQLPAQVLPKRAFGKKILKPADLVKYKEENSLSFSLSGLGMIDAADLGAMSREQQLQRLVNHARREAARWERTFAEDTPNAKAAEAMGAIASIQGAVYKVLPPKYRPALSAQMRFVEVYARMLESGRVSAKGRLSKGERATMLEQMRAELGAKMEGLQGDAARELQHLFVREWGETNLAQAAARMLHDAADAVERWLIDAELGRVELMKERLAPRKLPNGKYDKGRMSAAAYRDFVRFCGLMELDADAVSGRLQELEALIAAEEGKDAPDADKVDALAGELAELVAYGGLKHKGLADVRKGVAALAAFVQSERSVWQGRLERERERAKRSARCMAELMGRGDEVTLAEHAERDEGTLRMFSSMGSGFMSLSQMFYGMGGIPGLRSLVDESLAALAQGHVQLGLREKRAYGQLAEFLEGELGLDSEAKRNDWMARLKRKFDTGVRRAGELVTHKLQLSREEAEEWLEMGKAERAEKRRKMLDEADGAGVEARNVVYEEDVPLLREELARLAEAPGRRKYVRTERSWRREQVGSIVASRDEILNVLLLCEQDDYRQAADENGYTAEVLEKLRAAVGEDVMAYGYAMRRVLEGSGLAAVYEEREGIPFPAVQNYWPGRFDLSAKMNEQANALDPTTGTGTRYGMLITRVKHKLKFDLSLGASNVFLAALAQQNNYICMGELTARWRRLLAHADFAMALKQRLGDRPFRQLKELLNLLDGAGIAESVTQQNLSSLVARFQSAHAMAVLAGSPITLVKQTSALLHAGAWEGVSPLRVVWHLLTDRVGRGAISYGEVARMDCFRVRLRDNRYFTEMLQLGRNANWSRLATWARTGMGWIEKMDVVCNVASMTALYNIRYEQLQKANEGAADPLSEAEMRSICERAVEQALELGAQPLRRTQKSAMAALSRNALVQSACYMSSESLNKIGMYAAIRQRSGGGIRGRLAGLKYLLPMSMAQQATVMVLDMLRGSAPDSDDDEWAEWFWLNVATGCTGLGMLQSVPMLGEAVDWATGGRVKTASLGEMLFDFRGAARSGKRLLKMGSDDKEYSGWEWAWQLVNAGRIMTAATAAGRGINSTSKVFSELSGGLQSLNAVVNHVRPLIQRMKRADE